MKKITGALFLLAFSAALQAQESENTANERRVTGETIVTGATNTEKSKNDVSATVNVVGSQEINQSDASTVAELLRDVPGVIVEDHSGMSGVTRISIRGESGNRILILIDGVKQSENSSPSGAPLLLDPNIIERIEVIKGAAASALYGSEGIGGVINIITKKDKSGKPISGDTSHMFNSSDNSYTGALNLYGRLGAFDYRVGGSYTEAQNRKTPDGEIQKTHFTNMSWNALLGYNWESGRIGLAYSGYRAEPGIPDTMNGSTLVITTPKHWDRDTATISYEQHFDSDVLARLSGNIYYQQLRKHVEMQWEGMLELDSIMRNTQHSFGFNGQADFIVSDRNYLIAGIDYSGDWLANRNKERTEMMGNEMGYDTLYFDAYRHTWALFAQDEWNIIDPVTITAGLRYNMALSGISSVEDGSINGMEAGSRFDHKLAGNAGFLFEPLEGFNVRLNYGHGYRTPTLTESLAGSIGHAGMFYILPNPDLKPETSHQGELGLRFFRGNFDIDLAGAYTYGVNYITSVPVGENDGNGVPYQYLNIDKAHTVSAELTARYLIEAIALTPYVSGTYTYRYFDNDGFGTAKTGIAPWRGKVGLGYTHRFSDSVNFRADINTVLASESQYLSAADADVIDVDGWYTLNLGLGFDFFADNNLSLDMGLNNITNVAYTKQTTESNHGNAEFLEPGRHFYIKMTARF
jgi:hemoglobin/transferrin/lactoferrin receptor protein